MTPEPDISSPVSLPAVGKTPRQDSWLGPLFYWEMLREIRKIRSYLPRVLFALVLLLQMYLSIGSADITQKQAAYFSERNVNNYLLFQYLAVAFLTPIFVCGAVIEERQQGTLSIMLTTYLTTGEWLRGKMMGRLAPMLTLLITGIPILALMQLFGGVNIFNVIMHSLLAAVLMLAVGMHAIYCSVQEKTVGRAIFSSYMLLVGGTFLGYLLAWPLSAILMATSLANRDWIFAVLAFSIILMHMWLGARSFGAAVKMLEKRTRDFDASKSPSEQFDLNTRLKSLETELVKVIRNPAVNSDLDTKEQQVLEVVEPDASVKNRKSTIYSRWPLVWKGSRFPSSIGLFITTLLVILIDGTMILALLFAASVTRSAEFVYYLGVLNQIILVPLMMTVTLRASSVIVTERKNQTWLILLTLPWSHARLVFELAVGALWRYRWLLLFCILITLLNVFVLNISVTLALLLTYSSQLIFFCLIGLLISAISRTVFISRICTCLFLVAMFLWLPMIVKGSEWDSISLLLPVQTWLAVNLNRIDFVADPITAVITQSLLSAACFGTICSLIKLQTAR
ncbi:MAG: hypothetical protein JNJ77_21785 [Planctomycetia bacterium]|nr:hypothetical protein [Planctomycetia bacterium]